MASSFLERNQGYKGNPFDIKVAGILNSSTANGEGKAINASVSAGGKTKSGSTEQQPRQSLMTGSYTFPNGDVYRGTFYDQQLHGHGTIYFGNNGGKMDCEWENGRLVSGTYAFSDGLVYGPTTKDWDYCIEVVGSSSSNGSDKGLVEKAVASSVPTAVPTASPNLKSNPIPKSKQNTDVSDSDSDEEDPLRPEKPSPMTIIERSPTKPTLQRKWTSASTPRLPHEQTIIDVEVSSGAHAEKKHVTLAEETSHISTTQLAAKDSPLENRVRERKSHRSTNKSDAKLALPGVGEGGTMGERRASLAISMAGSNVSTGSGGRDSEPDDLSSGSLAGFNDYAASQYIQSQPEDLTNSDNHSSSMNTVQQSQHTKSTLLASMPAPTASTLGLNALNLGSQMMGSNVSIVGNSSISLANQDLSDPVDNSAAASHSNVTSEANSAIPSANNSSSFANLKTAVPNPSDALMSLIKEEEPAGESASARRSDRRFYTERVQGLEGAGRSRIANNMPAPTLPSTLFYDVGDGYFDAGTGKVMAWNGIQVIRIPDAEEINWILAKCRHG